MTKLLLFGSGPSRKDVDFMMNVLGMRGAILAIPPVVVSVLEKKEGLFSDEVSSLLNFFNIDFAGLALRIREKIRLDVDINPNYFTLNSNDMYADEKFQVTLNYRFTSVGQEKIRKCLVFKRGRR